MKRLRWILMLVSLFFLTTCGSDDGMDQNTNDPDNTTGQTNNPAPDADEDGIPDDDDQCPDTPTDEQADENGCSPSQLDSDNDGVNDALDECPDTLAGATVNEQGCSDSQKDSDGDGVNDAEDQCPDTPENEEVDENGCSLSQKDTDGDGISDDIDVCPDTPEDRVVNEQGCHTPEIGEFYQGGYVFHIFQEGEYGYVENEVHGLIMAPENYPENVYWANSTQDSIQVFDDFFGYDDGMKNTEKIIMVLGDSINAAGVCYNLILNDFDDWYLPSSFEGDLICTNINEGYASNPNPNIPEEIHVTGGGFWLSNEAKPVDYEEYIVYPAINIWMDTCITNEDPDIFKADKLNVRPIRRF